MNTQQSTSKTKFASTGNYCQAHFSLTPDTSASACAPEGHKKESVKFGTSANLRARVIAHTENTDDGLMAGRTGN